MALSSSNCSVEISKDGMEALLTLLDDSALEGLSAESIGEALVAAGVRHGFDQGAMGMLASAPAVKRPCVVARGEPAQDPGPEEIVYHFKVGQNTSPVEGEDGTVDFRNLDNFNSTPAGTVIAEKTRKGDGIVGMTVKGERIEPKPLRPFAWKIGKGVAVSEDGNSVIAQVAGHACLSADRLTVMETIDIPGDVDFSVGNVHFIGNVRVKGGVHPGFNIEAGGDIEIGGNVEKAFILAGGKLSVKGIVFGHGGSLLRSAGEMHIGALDQAKIECMSDLRVDQYIRHSHLLVGGQLVISGQKGSLIGGEALVYRNIDVPVLGNAMATLTKVTVGGNPFANAGITEQEALLSGLNAKANQISSAIHGLMARRKAGGGQSPEETALLAKYSQAHGQLKEQIDAALAKIEEYKHQSGDNKDARIKVSEISYPGVLLNFRGRLQFKTKDEAQRTCYYEKDAEVAVGPY
jgi:uncharacterized protein